MSAGNLPITILIQGGIASGKSTVARALVDRGAQLIDCDKVAHEILELPEVRDAVREAFGEQVITGGQVDRKALAGIVFEDEAALARLEALVHPGIGRRIEAVLEDSRTPAGQPRQVVVIDAAVAEKMKLDESVDIRLFVAVDLEVRKRRARDNRGWDEGELERREANQGGVDAKERAADHVVRNDGGLQEVEEHVKRFWTDVIEPRR